MNGGIIIRMFHLSRIWQTLRCCYTAQHSEDFPGKKESPIFFTLKQASFTALAFVVVVDGGLGSGYSLLHNSCLAIMRAHLLMDIIVVVDITIGTCYYFGFFFETVAKDGFCYVDFEGYWKVN